jgi:sugar lactone lactonase YvrE
VAELRTEVWIEGLSFPEGPRWHEGRLWFSDMHAGRVVTADTGGRIETVCRVEAAPSGLGWLPDGRLLVVSMTDRRLLRLDDGALEVHADLSSLATFHCNDMVVDDRGRAYVGHFGFDLHGGASVRPAALVRVDPDGRARIAADELLFPNGTVLTPDGRTLVVGESFGARLTAYDVAADGGLSGRREWARLEKAVPDGICLDAEGAIWVASPVSAEVLRVEEGGRVTHRVPVTTQAFACMLGGDDGRTLFVCTAESSDPALCRDRATGRIETVRAPAPRAGRP